jgi:hypothetical protein
LKLWESIAEDIFFFQYHMHQSTKDCMSLPIDLRKWLINRFLKQKEKENEQMEAERRRARSKR